MTMTLTRDDVQERDQERRRARIVRSQRVELLDLPACTLCGGTTAVVDDDELRCVCEAQRSALQSRLARLVAEHVDPDRRDLADVISP